MIDVATLTERSTNELFCRQAVISLQYADQRSAAPTRIPSGIVEKVVVPRRELQRLVLRQERTTQTALCRALHPGLPLEEYHIAVICRRGGQVPFRRERSDGLLAWSLDPVAPFLDGPVRPVRPVQHFGMRTSTQLITRFNQDDAGDVKVVDECSSGGYTRNTTSDNDHLGLGCRRGCGVVIIPADDTSLCQCQQREELKQWDQHRK